jgi:chromosome segregation protein
MTKLDRIVMQGFKSFASKVVLPLPGGFTAVAGPNGSGKSNIVDAVTFVLGTTSARHIRAHKLQNLIFNGAASRKPAEYCEVSLAFDNSDGRIPGGEKEMTITRRITRSGISVYKINGKTAIRSKVVDLLSAAGLSPDGHNIIMQGDVTRIIEMSPKERRGIIDEISGIAEFNEKKEEALRKLERVETRVNEAMAVILEKQRRVEQLKVEKENAEKYQKLNEQLKRALASSIALQLDAAEEEEKKLRDESKGSTKEASELGKSVAGIEKELESKEKELKSLADEIIKRRGVDTVRLLERVSGEILRKRDRIELIQSQIQNLPEERPRESELVKMLPVEARQFSSVITVPKEYSTAINVAIGPHARDIIVRTDSDAVKAIHFLRERQLGRARFLPLNKIRTRARQEFQQGKGFVGWALDLISYDQAYYTAVSHVLGHTIIVDTIENARKMARHGLRFVTLDGDTIEPSGAMVGGSRQRVQHPAAVIDVDRLRKEKDALTADIEKLARQLEDLQKKEKEDVEKVGDLYKAREDVEKALVDVRKMRNQAVEQKFALQSRLNRIGIEQGRLEERIKELRERGKEHKDFKERLDLPLEELQNIIRTTTNEIRSLGLVNMRAIEEYNTMSVEFVAMKEKLEKLLQEKNAIVTTINEVEKKRQEKFSATLSDINTHFQRIYTDLTGGAGQVRLEEAGNIDSGLVIEASPSGKKVLDLDAMSGGEKTMASLAFVFSIVNHYASPFYVLDEIDAALDKANTKKVASLVRKYCKEVQFIVISHNDIMTAAADKVFGVAMEEGASKVFGIELPKR